MCFVFLETPDSFVITGSPSPGNPSSRATRKSKIPSAREDSARQPLPQQGSLQGGDQAGHPLAKRQRALCWSSPSPAQKRLWLGGGCDASQVCIALGGNSAWSPIPHKLNVKGRFQ